MKNISIPDETYRRLADRAAVAGTTVDQFVMALLDKTTSEPVPADRGDAFAALIQLVTDHAANLPGHALDVSRDAIYEDRLRSQM